MGYALTKPHTYIVNDRSSILPFTDTASLRTCFYPVFHHECSTEIPTFVSNIELRKS